ncbi:hypothetical protein LOD99_14634 [Oopsacas minuta]|uniref:Uncharacterized protein n=1 Tax=Oopsacas minuta TaxID=111878 RepID=A0AAV7KGL9_9METZ|nr:hypothetical protein LOD99_14634 [Oopsacas minuta]
MRDYPLTVLLPVMLESKANSQFMDVASDTEESRLNLEVLCGLTPNPAQRCISYTPCSMFECLCPVWQGEFNDILHLNTCSIDNIISLLSLWRGKIEGAMDFSGIS